MCVFFCTDDSWRRSADFPHSRSASHLQKKRVPVGSRIDCDVVDTGKFQVCVWVHSRFVVRTCGLDFRDSEHTDCGNIVMYAGPCIRHDCKDLMEKSKDLGVVSI